MDGSVNGKLTRHAYLNSYADLDLRKELSSRSFSCGPIVGTTRSVYKKKLVDMLLDEELPAEARIARAAPSSEEEEEEEVVPQVSELIKQNTTTMERKRRSWHR